MNTETEPRCPCGHYELEHVMSERAGWRRCTRRCTCLDYRREGKR